MKYYQKYRSYIMSVLINVPTPLRTITKDRTVEVEGQL